MWLGERQLQYRGGGRRWEKDELTNTCIENGRHCRNCRRQGPRQEQRTARGRPTDANLRSEDQACDFREIFPSSVEKMYRWNFSARKILCCFYFMYMTIFRMAQVPRKQFIILTTEDGQKQRIIKHYKILKRRDGWKTNKFYFNKQNKHGVIGGFAVKTVRFTGNMSGIGLLTIRQIYCVIQYS